MLSRQRPPESQRRRMKMLIKDGINISIYKYSNESWFIISMWDSFINKPSQHIYLQRYLHLYVVACLLLGTSHLFVGCLCCVTRMQPRMVYVQIASHACFLQTWTSAQPVRRIVRVPEADVSTRWDRIVVSARLASYQSATSVWVSVYNKWPQRLKGRGPFHTVSFTSHSSDSDPLPFHLYLRL